MTIYYIAQDMRVCSKIPEEIVLANKAQDKVIELQIIYLTESITFLFFSRTRCIKEGIATHTSAAKITKH